MAWFGLALCVAAAAALLVTYMGSRFIINDPNRKPLVVDPGRFGLIFEAIEFRNDDGQLLKGWIVPAKQPKAPRRTILLCHGWGTNKGFIFEDTKFLAERGGYDLVYFDTRACGDSEGKINSIGYLETFDCDAAFRFLRERRPELLERLGIWGRSMGGAVALVAGVRHPEVRSLVIEAAFASHNEVISRWSREKTFVPEFPILPMTRAWIRLRLGADPEVMSPIRHIADLDASKPVFYIQGDSDWLMPVSEAERLYSLTRGPKELWVVKGADHDECRTVGPEEYEKRVLAFYDRTL